MSGIEYDMYPPDKDDIDVEMFVYLSDGYGAIGGCEPLVFDKPITFWPAGGGTFTEILIKSKDGGLLATVPLKAGEVDIPVHGSLTVSLKSSVYDGRVP